MNHAVIGLAHNGALCLAKIAKLFDELLQPHQEPPAAFFALDTQDENIGGKLPFVCFDFQEASMAVVDEMDQIFACYGGVTADIAKSRRFFSLRFRYEYSRIEKVFTHFVQNVQGKPVFHIVADISRPSDSAVLTELLLMLRSRYEESTICVYLLCPQKMPEELAAQWYAALIECGVIASEQMVFYRFVYGDKKSLDEELKRCSRQIFHATLAVVSHAGIPTIERNELNDIAWVQMHEVALRLDFPAMRESLAKQTLIEILRQVMRIEQNVGEVPTPSWVEELFIDKKWLLHPDIMLMDDDRLFSPKPNTYSSIEKEWASRTRYFLDQVDGENEWINQVEQLSNALENVHLKLFRGRGVDLFYAFNGSSVTNIARHIASEIEQQLAQDWLAQKYDLSQAVELCTMISGRINTRADGYMARYGSQNDLAEQLLAQHQQLIKEYQSGNRAKKKIANEYPIQKIADILEKYYVHRCHSKAAIFAAKLLAEVSNAIGDVKQNIHYLVTETQKYINSTRQDSGVIRVRPMTSIIGDVFQAISCEMPLLEYMPKSFRQDLQSLAEEMQMDFGKHIDISDGFKGIIKKAELPRLTNTMSALVSTRHPFFSPSRAVELENRLFWPTMAYLSARNNQDLANLFARALDLPVGKLGHRLWLIPPTPLSKDQIGHMLEGFMRYTPQGRCIVNVSMTIPFLLFRHIQVTDSDKLSEFSYWQSCYENALNTPEGVAHSMAWHTQNKTPFPDYRASNKNEELDMGEVRSLLLEGALRGAVRFDGESVVLVLGDAGIVLGSTIVHAAESMQARTLKLLRHSVKQATALPEASQVPILLNQCLDHIRVICLNGKDDIRYASWQEAGSFMPWARAADDLTGRYS